MGVPWLFEFIVATTPSGEMRCPAVIAQQFPRTLRYRHKGHLVRGAAAIEMALLLAGVLARSIHE
jgi:hypothetical protein